MHVVIVGGGRVGRELAANLTEKHQTVVIVEKDLTVADKLKKKLDVMIVNDDGANMATLEKAGIRNAGICIAVTQIDELNLMVCMMADRAGVPTTIARVRNPESHTNIADTGFSKDEIGVDYVINPERELALEISKRIHYPDASEIEYFADGKVMMVATKVTEDAEMIDFNLMEMPLPKGCIIVGIKRADGTFVVPSGDDIVNVDDKVYLVGNVKVMRKASWLLHHKETIVKKVLILGGDTVGYTLASILENNAERKFKVKLIEIDEKKCEELNRKLSKTMVLQGNYNELAYFNQEEISETDALITVTGDDRSNLVASIMAEKLGVGKIIAEISNNEYSYIYDTVDVDNYVNSHLITANKILRFTRKGDVLTLSHLKEENAELVELVVPKQCKAAGIKVKDARFPKGMIIGTIVRNGEIIVPYGETVLQPGDNLIIFTLTSVSRKLESYFC